MGKKIFILVVILLSVVSINNSYAGRGLQDLVPIVEQLNRRFEERRQQQQQEAYLYQQAMYESQIQAEQAEYQQQVIYQQVEYQRQAAFLQEANRIRDFIYTILISRNECYEGVGVIKKFAENNRNVSKNLDLQDLYFGRDKVGKAGQMVEELVASNVLLEDIKKTALIELRNIKEGVFAEIKAFEDEKKSSAAVRFFYGKNFPKLENEFAEKIQLALRFGEQVNKKIVDYMESNRTIFGDEACRLIKESYGIKE